MSKIKLFSILALLLTVTQGAWATGELTGVFSVSVSKKVCFSKGNLQYIGENSWKFADNQWETFGENQSDNHRDLFGWGTGNNPNQTSEDNNDYATFNDWGNNSNLQTQLGTGWRTLSNDEWHYLFKTRTVKDGTGAGHSYTLGQSVNGRLGVVIYPDNYAGALYTTGANWSTFEAAGCVFLPAAGTRYGNKLDNTDKGYYWSSTPNYKFAFKAAYSVHISDQLYTENSPFPRKDGQSVRLVREVEDAYTANFATGNDNTDWTIDPASPVAEGVEVTATYSGSRHVKSVIYRPAGTIGGQFTINGSGDKVYFSKGNLQLVGENSWKFADNQWETFGENQSDNHRDLFGWCTVATPNKTSEDDDYSSDNAWGDDPYLQACVGTGWHLITGGNYGEWNYLLNNRTTTSGIRYAVGSVNGKNGLILLPDDWNAEYYALNNTNKVNGPYGDNVISLSDWTEKLEAHGAVFLPAGGHRIGTNLYVVNDIGHYWCSTRQANGDVMRIDEELILPNWALDFYYGCSVRLVKAVSSLELTPNAEKTEWTLASMPAYDIELSAEYYDEVTLTDGEAITALNTYTGQEIWVNYTRSFTADKASTVCLPFAYTKKTGDGSFYEFTGIEKVDNEYIATMTEPGTSTLTANTPYLYKAATTGNADFSGTYTIPASITAGETTSGDWTFIGTYSTINWTEAPTGIYGFSAQVANDGITQGQFVKVGSYVRIKPMRAYLQYNGSDSQFKNARSLTRAAATTSDDTLPETIGVRLISANGEVTAIGTLYTRTGEVSFDSEAWYTLDGKRLNAKPNTKGIYIQNGKKVVIK